MCYHMTQNVGTGLNIVIIKVVTLISLVSIMHLNSKAIQARSQKILMGGSFEGNVDLLFQPTNPGAVKELIWCMHIAHIHEGL